MLTRERPDVLSLGSPWSSRERARGLPTARVERHLWLVPDTPMHSAAPVTTHLRLTRRGRVVFSLGLLGVVALAVLIPVGISSAGSKAASLRVRYITVQPGQTLWGIAQEALPQEDPRDAVLRLQELNALVTANVWAGQRLAIPQAAP